MTALIVVESSFGNTRQVAESVKEGLARHTGVDLVDVAQAPARLPEGLDLLVVGGPTHAFGMSRPTTRADAARQGAARAGDTGIREWIAALAADTAKPPVATFDTRTKHRWIPGSAAAQAAAALRARGFPVAAAAESFRVDDVPGPLLRGETARAQSWADRLGSRLAARPAT